MTAIRVLLIMVAAVTLLGIWLTGFHNVHWVLYLPVIMLGFAGISGFCPGIWLLKKIGFKGPALNG